MSDVGDHQHTECVQGLNDIGIEWQVLECQRQTDQVGDKDWCIDDHEAERLAYQPTPCAEHKVLVGEEVVGDADEIGHDDYRREWERSVGHPVQPGKNRIPEHGVPAAYDKEHQPLAMRPPQTRQQIWP